MRQLLILIHCIHGQNEVCSVFSHLYNIETYRILFLEILRSYFKEKLEELSNMMAVGHEEDGCEFQFNNNGLGQPSQRPIGVGEMDIDTCYHGSTFAKNNTLVNNIGKVVCDLRNLGFTSMTEDAYASSILLLLKDKVHDLAGDDYRTPVLGSIKEWIQVLFVLGSTE
ncbi:hypothetical protein B296_00007421 [Ensete ventricosum]|uniref:Uncharacterized protein n=1 Tax=Ensete ventricosum TaxID=4639 RepID=A0A427BBL9_ENSVE|nr:hypothetical protein B296_00007421 [Ensete ventricosum]